MEDRDRIEYIEYQLRGSRDVQGLTLSPEAGATFHIDLSLTKRQFIHFLKCYLSFDNSIHYILILFYHLPQNLPTSVL